MVEHDSIAYAESGLKGFENRSVQVYGGEGQIVLIVWTQERQVISRDDFDQIMTRMRGLELAFC